MTALAQTFPFVLAAAPLQYFITIQYFILSGKHA